jgi:WD40 repeat protein
VGVVYDKVENTQSFYHGHTDEVLSMVVHPAGNFVASGPRGNPAFVHVWDSTTLETAAVLELHTVGVNLLAFNADGSKLASVGMDNDHIVALWDWRANKMVASGIGGTSNLLGVAFSGDSTTICAVGVKTIEFFVVDKRALKSKPGRITHIGKRQTFCSVAYVHNTAFVGCCSGEIYKFDSSRICVQTFQAHGVNEPVNSLRYCEETGGLISGAKDGLSVTWDKQMKMVGTPVDMAEDVGALRIGTQGSIIDCSIVSAVAKGNYVLVGTRGGDIFEVKKSGANPYVKQILGSHANCVLGSIANHPNELVFASTGDDKTLRIWSIRRKCLIDMRILPSVGSSLTFSSSGSHLCLGMASGAFAIYDMELNVVTAFQHSQRSISALRYSPNDKVLAVGSEDTNIYLYAADKNYSRLGVCRGHTDPVVHIDFSKNSLFMQSNDTNYGINYWDHWGETASLDLFCSYGPHSASCTLSWQCMGVWKQSDGGEVTSASVDMSTSVLCCADDYGRLKLYNYPVPDTDDNLFSCHRGHAGEICKVRFAAGGHYLISAGKHDCCVFQWSHDVEEFDDEEEDLENYNPDDPSGRSKPLSPSDAHPMAPCTPFAQKPLTAILSDLNRTNPHLVDELEAADSLVTRSESISKKGQIKHYLSKIVEPSDFRFSDSLLGSTDCALNLNWVHGYRSQDCRNTLRYSSSGGVIFACAALGVCYNKSTNEQKFQQGTHIDDILCLAVHPDGNFCATGEVGDMPKIVVWDCATMDTKAVLSGFHKRGVGQLKFNGPGNLLLSVGLDDYNSVAIYNWEQERVIATAVVSLTKVMAACFVKDKVMLGGNQMLKFFSAAGDSLVSQNGVFGRNGLTTAEDFFCMNAEPLTGDYSIATGVRGEVLIWDKHTCCKEKESIRSGSFRHEACVASVWTSEVRTRSETKWEVVTGDSGGVIALWDFVVQQIGDDEVGKKFREQGMLCLKRVLRVSDLVGFDINDCTVRSVCLMNDDLLIGTGGSEIFEVKVDDSLNYSEFQGVIKWPKLDDLNVTCFNEGHYSGDVWGLATHPGKNLFCSGGDDKCVRLWDFGERNCIKTLMIEEKCRALAYQPCGQWNQDNPHLAVGLNTGKVLVLDGELKGDSFLAELDRATQWIQHIKYSFEGSRLVVGSHDECIYVYDVFNAYSYVNKIEAHHNYIVHFDFGTMLREGEKMNERGVVVSKDKGVRTRNVEVGEIYMTTSCGDKHLKFFNLETLVEETSANKVKDLVYSTITGTIGFSVQGIGGKAGPDSVLCVDRNHIYDKVPVLATGDEFGVIRLYNYPCVNEGAAEKTYVAHSAAVRELCFSYDDGYLVSVGGQDRTICIWKTDIKEEARELAAAGGGGNASESEGGWGENDDVDAEEMEEGLYLGKGRSGGDEFMAVKPYLGAIREPSGWKESEDDLKKPDAELLLNFAYGYRAQDCRSNLFYGDSATEIVYHVAGIGIKYDIESKQQLFNLQHEDDILCLAVHPEGHTVATGEIGKHPKIVVWDSNSGSTLAVYKGFHERGVSLIQFSADGKLIYSVGMDDDHSVAVYGADPDTNLGQLIAKAKGSRSKMLALSSFGDRDFCTAGKREVKFWSCDVVKGEIQSKKGLFGRKAKNTTCVSTCYLGPDCVTGQADGSIYLWKGRNASVIRREHTKCVNSLGRTGSGLVSGGKDGLVILWSESLVMQRQFDLATFSSTALNTEVRSVCCTEQKILIGLYSSEIVELDLATGKDKGLLCGHFGGELWGLDNHPTTSNAATVGDDGILCVWDTQRCERIAVRSLGGKARSIAYNNDGSFVAVGMYSGNVVVFQEPGLVKKVDVKIAKEWIQVLKYSPDGSTLAVGSHDNNIYLVETRTYTRRSVCKGHSSFITHLDWSGDSKFLQSNCGAYELLFWGARDGKQVKNPSSLKDTMWHGWTCVLGWPVQGIFGGGRGGSDIDACAKVGNNLVVGGDDGKVSLYRYPCLKMESERKEYSGHSSHVTNVAVGFDNKHVYSVGGLDRALLQFSLAK